MNEMRVSPSLMEKPLPGGIHPAQLAAERSTGKQELLCIVPN